MDFKCILLAALPILAAGCASFSPDRESQFVDENQRYLFVEYAKGEVRETEFVAPNGVRLPFKSSLQVRVTLPDGEQFIGYHNMSAVGNVYFSDDREWEYFEKGTGCILARRDPKGPDYLIYFQGVMCRNGRTKPLDKKVKSYSGGSTPSGFGHDSSGPRDSDGPRTVEQETK